MDLKQFSLNLFKIIQSDYKNHYQNILVNFKVKLPSSQKINLYAY